MYHAEQMGRELTLAGVKVPQEQILNRLLKSLMHCPRLRIIMQEIMN